LKKIGFNQFHLRVKSATLISDDFIADDQRPFHHRAKRSQMIKIVGGMVKNKSCRHNSYFAIIFCLDGVKSVSNHSLNTWFEENRRAFPWREDPTPYSVWVSEVMLQQTRASVVVPYFERWMITFPSVAALAVAPIEQVIKMWEGLGYYSRARNLHRGAQQIVDDFGGVIPSTKEELLKIRGLGPYTVAAILSFGFKQRAAAVDGNVLRVITRYAWIDQDIQKVATKRVVAEFVESFLDEKQPWVTSEALIELGATICTPAPRCALCPIQSGCAAYSRCSRD
jgi:A/G-specific adenine glycosylase